MSRVGEEEVRQIREAYEAFNRGDFEAARGLLHPEIVWHRVAEVEGSFQGPDQVLEFMKPDLFATQRNDVHAIEVVGDDHILVDATFHGEGASSGIKLDQRGFHLWRIEDGKAIEFRYFTDRDQALQAARS